LKKRIIKHFLFLHLKARTYIFFDDKNNPKLVYGRGLKIIIPLSCSLVFWEIKNVKDNALGLCILIAPFSSNANNFALEKSSSFE
jgi:hypothetical protein